MVATHAFVLLVNLPCIFYLACHQLQFFHTMTSACCHAWHLNRPQCNIFVLLLIFESTSDTTGTQLISEIHFNVVCSSLQCYTHKQKQLFGTINLNHAWAHDALVQDVMSKALVTVSYLCGSGFQPGSINIYYRPGLHPLNLLKYVVIKLIGYFKTITGLKVRSVLYY